MAQAKIISSSAGKVGDRVITTREVMIYHLVEDALFNSKNNKLPQTTLDLTKIHDRQFIRETTAVLIELAIFFEAESFSANEVSKNIIQQSISLAEKRLKKNALWLNLKVDSQELESVVRKKLNSKEFIKFKVDAANIPTSEKEIEDYYNNNRLKFENLPLANFRENIKSYLIKQQIDKRIKDWVELLQIKYHVRNYLAE
ncbi:MAG: hypothetical protein ABL927_05490 [Bdellovibrionales bacterium]